MNIHIPAVFQTCFKLCSGEKRGFRSYAFRDIANIKWGATDGFPRQWKTPPGAGSGEPPKR